MPSIRLLCSCLVAALLVAGAAPARASASPGGYRVLIVHAACETPTVFQGQLAAFPDVASVDAFDACDGTPTAQQLANYDVVASMSNMQYQDPISYGNALADFVDGGGVAVQYAYDTWSTGPDGPNGPRGRFATGGYEPLLPGPATNNFATLGAFDASNPLMQGVTELTSQNNTTAELAPGADLVAKWSDGRALIATKGRVVSVSSYVGTNEANNWSGDFARVGVNAVRTMGRQGLTVENLPPSGGSVSVGGAGCAGSGCVLRFAPGTPVGLTATPYRGYAFSGYSGDCTGPACALRMSTQRRVGANFVRFGIIGKAKRNEKNGSAILTVRAGAAGSLTLSGKGVRRRARALATDSRLKIPIVARGRAARRLRMRGQAKVGVKIAYTPSAGATSRVSAKVRLVRNSG
jgi:hypothetical protein